jgi:hypothetical protein
MAKSTNQPPHSLGLGGDGDEIAAIAEVERRFGVKLDYAESAQWVTAGDVYSALQKALLLERGVAENAWPMFAEAISQETGVDGNAITPETLLLGEGRFGWRIAIGIASVAGIALAVARNW